MGRKGERECRRRGIRRERVRKGGREGLWVLSVLVGDNKP